MQPKKIMTLMKAQFPKHEVKKVRLYHIVDKAEMEKTELREWNYYKYVKTDLSLLAAEIYEIIDSVVTEMDHKEKFHVCGYKQKCVHPCATIPINQAPEKEEGMQDPSPEGMVTAAMQFAENAYAKLDEVLSKQAVMQKDLMNSYHKRLVSLEKREEVLSDILREFRDINVDREDRQRKEERIDRMVEVFAGYLAPAAAEKMLSAGLISAETAAGISAAGKELSEEISDKPDPKKKVN